MILIPGLSSSGAVWDETVVRFRDRYQTHTLTLAGFAGVAPLDLAPGKFLDTIANAIAAYIREKKLDKPILVGHSLGGFLVYQLALNEPSLIGSGVAVDGLPSLAALVTPTGAAEQFKHQGEQWMRVPMESARRDQFDARSRQMVSTWLEDKSRADLVNAWGAASDQKTVARAMGDLWSRDLRGALARLKTPILLVGAPVGPPGVTREQMEQSYASQLTLAPVDLIKVVFAAKARHFIMYDEPEWLWAEIDHFLVDAATP